MEKQSRAIALAGELTDVPVPRIIGGDNDASILGSPFFVMERIDGIVPPDVMPYTFGDNWLYDASPDDQQTLVDSTVDVLASLHGIGDADDARSASSSSTTPGDSAMRRHLEHTRRGTSSRAGTRRGRTLLDADVRLARRALPRRRRRVPSSAGATRGSATSCTATSVPWRCSIGRWPGSAPVSSTWPGSCSRTACSSISPDASAHRACRTSCVRTTSPPPTSARPDTRRAISTSTWPTAPSSGASSSCGRASAPCTSASARCRTTRRSSSTARTSSRR